MGFGLEQGSGSSITPMVLAHPLHPIRSRSRNKHRNLWFGWCVSSWWHRFYFVYSIYYHVHSMYYCCILNNWNKSFLIYFNCIVQDSLYHNMYIGTMWHCAIVSCTPSQSRCCVSLCVLFTNSLIEWYFIMIVATIWGIFMAILLFFI